jgi:adenylate cyclase
MPGNVSQELEAKWRSLLIDGHKIRLSHALFKHLPSEPRCKICHNPFGGLGGKLVGLFGFRPSPKNPNVCSQCCDGLPDGGAEIDVAVLFADVRGSTHLAEGMESTAYAELLNRYYLAASRVLVRHDAIIDKFIGDEVMALFIPGIAGEHYRERAAEAAIELLEAVGYGSEAGPWIEIGVGVQAGDAYVGNVGADGMVDLTAIGDTVTVSARPQSATTRVRSTVPTTRDSSPPTIETARRMDPAPHGIHAHQELSPHLIMLVGGCTVGAPE